MKICQFEREHSVYWGAVKDDSIFPIKNIEDFSGLENQLTGESFEVKNVRFLALSPSKIVCVGRNYAEHAAELGNAVPTEPLLFLKAPSSIIGDGEMIKIPPQSGQVEHEGELAVIIRRICRNLTADDDPFDYILGYTCLNDVTARDLQRKDVQFTRAKSFDTFCPIYPVIETQLDITDVRVQTRVNGIIKQNGSTSQMVFDVPFLIRYISNQMTLNHGDVIATGTPSGVSKLNVGDVCEVEVEGIGVLKNPVGRI